MASGQCFHRGGDDFFGHIPPHISQHWIKNYAGLSKIELGTDTNSLWGILWTVSIYIPCKNGQNPHFSWPYFGLQWSQLAMKIYIKKNTKSFIIHYLQ